MVLGLLGNHIAEEYGIPMRARMIHTVGGDTYPVPYGEEDQCIYSVGRRYVNEILLTGTYSYSSKMPCLPIIIINFSWPTSHNFFIMEKSKFT